MNCSEGTIAQVHAKCKSVEWLDGRVVICMKHVSVKGVDSWTVYPPLLRDDGKKVVSAIPDAWLSPFTYVNEKAVDETLYWKDVPR